VKFVISAINKGDIKDTEMDEIMNRIVDSLFSVFVTLGTVPIIRSPKGNAAEMVAKKLEKKLRENLADARNNLLHSDTQSGNFNFQRPLLIVLDRNVDMATPLHHTWTYQALAHDLLNLNLNRVIIEESTPTGGRCCVASRISKPNLFICRGAGQESNVRARHERQILVGAQGLAVPHCCGSYSRGAGTVQIVRRRSKEIENVDGNRRRERHSAVFSYGQHGENHVGGELATPASRKKETNRHAHLNCNLSVSKMLFSLIKMYCFLAVLNVIKSRKLDNFFELEEKILSKTQALDKTIYDLIADPGTGTPEDKMRLFIIFYICTPHMSDSDLKRYEAALTEAGCDLSPTHYIKRWKYGPKSVTNRFIRLKF
jgi:hypothetical protein